jgi:hypothetical protein
MQYKNIIWFIIFLTLFSSCSDADKTSKSKNVSLSECVTHKNDFKKYFESNVTPLFSIPSIETPKAITVNIINDLSHYSDIFSNCDLIIIKEKVIEKKVIENEYAYFSISNSLSILVSLMKEIEDQELTDKEVIDVLVKHMKNNYEKIINELSKS